MPDSNQKSIVVTTINAPTRAVLELAARKEWQLLVIGDNKTPSDWHVEGARFIPISQQRDSEWALAAGLPENHYCRKNLGYLEAISSGARVIAETDDDNLPGDWPPAAPDRSVRGRYLVGEGWVNIYPYFTNERIWPRGFPLQHINRSFEVSRAQHGHHSSSVHQYLASGDPDVDAVYRMTVGRDDHTFSNDVLVLAPNSLTTFNSQCTVWFPEAFPLLYLPSFVSFRMTDIWRSLIAQVCMWADSQLLSYHGDGVTQVRNEHNLVRDFDDEVVGYLRNDDIARTLMDLRLDPGVDAMETNLVTCYRALNEIGVIPDRELPLVDAWLSDLRSASTRNTP